MTTTGWGEAPDAERPPMPLTEQLLANRERGPGDTLAISLARGQATEAREAREAAAEARDPDEVAAAMINRGYAPGMISQLSMRLADTEAELADEEAKIEKAARRAERTRQMHERGQISAFGIAERMSGTDEGDQATADRLRRRADRLRGQIADAAAAISPPQELDADPFEAAASRAHEAFAQATRAKMAAAREGRTESRPFGSVSRGGLAVRAEQCVHCIDQGVDPETSFLLHSDPERNVPVTTTAQLPVPRDPDWETERTVRAAGAVPTGTLIQEQHNPIAYR